MKNKYKQMFDSFAPVRGDEELLRAVLDRKVENKMAANKFSKKIFIPVIAAAVLGATAVGASAAYRWSVQQGVRDIIDSKTTDVDYPKFDVNKLGGKELSDVIKCEGFDIHLKGIAADEHTAFLLYDLVFDEGFDYSLGENETWSCGLYPHLEVQWIVEYLGMRGNDHPGEPNPSPSSDSGFLGMEGNVAHLYSKFNISGITLTGKTLDYSAYSLGRYNTVTGEYEEVVDFDEMSALVTIDFDTMGDSVSLKPDKKITMSDDKTGTLTFAGIAPFTLTVRVDWDHLDDSDKSGEPVQYNENGKFAKNDQEADYLLKTLKVKFKDGTVKDISAFSIANGGSGKVEWMSDDDVRITKYSTSLNLVWEYPVDVTEIASVTIGDVELVL